MPPRRRTGPPSFGPWSSVTPRAPGPTFLPLPGCSKRVRPPPSPSRADWIGPAPRLRPDRQAVVRPPGWCNRERVRPTVCLCRARAGLGSRGRGLGRPRCRGLPRCLPGIPGGGSREGSTADPIGGVPMAPGCLPRVPAGRPDRPSSHPKACRARGLSNRCRSFRPWLSSFPGAPSRCGHARASSYSDRLGASGGSASLGMSGPSETPLR